MFLAVIFMCVTIFPHCQSAQTNLPCDNAIFGCGSFVQDGDLTACCSCLELYGANCGLSVLVFCDTIQTSAVEAICCPCPDSGSLSDSCSTSLKECADPEERRRILHLFKKARKISQQTIHRCGTPVTDECAGARTLRKLGRIYDEIHQLNQNITKDCLGHGSDDSRESSSSHISD